MVSRTYAEYKGKIYKWNELLDKLNLGNDGYSSGRIQFYNQASSKQLENTRCLIKDEDEEYVEICNDCEELIKECICDDGEDIKDDEEEIFSSRHEQNHIKTDKEEREKIENCRLENQERYEKYKDSVRAKRVAETDFIDYKNAYSKGVNISLVIDDAKVFFNLHDVQDDELEIILSLRNGKGKLQMYLYGDMKDSKVVFCSVKFAPIFIEILHNRFNYIVHDYYKDSGIVRREMIPQKIKDLVWQRDKGRCVICGNNENIEFDHIIPVSKGGSNTYKNVQILCEKCNRTKSVNI